MSGRHVHLLGICGYAVSGAALVAKQLGWTVTGSDEDAYPPTTDILRAAGIPFAESHEAANLERWGMPDLVVVGNQVRTGNPEWVAAVDRGLPVRSEMEFYAELTADRLRIAVCGTHGKTTTSALCAWMLETAGLSPGMRLGTTFSDLGGSARLGAGAPFVFEGDEYTTAPWDPRPKFLLTRPQLACVTRLELDHPDVYESFEAYRRPFVELAATMPAAGLLVLCADDPECAALAPHATCTVQTYGTAPGGDWVVDTAAVEEVRDGRAVQRFSVSGPQGVGRREVALTLPGAHNRQNAVAAWALARAAGASDDACLEACARFSGPSRRFEVIGIAGGVTVVDDYAHHPSETAATLAAARERFPGGRVLAVYVPHTFSRTLALLDDYATGFAGADLVVIGPIEPARERHLAHTVSSEDVAARARHSAREVLTVDSADAAIAAISARARPSDVVVCMSVRGFDDIARRCLAALEAVHAG